MKRASYRNGSVDNCPTCGQPWPAKDKRLCSACHQPIKRTQKWEFGLDSRPRHKVCNEVIDGARVLMQLGRCIITFETGCIR